MYKKVQHFLRLRLMCKSSNSAIIYAYVVLKRLGGWLIYAL